MKSLKRIIISILLVIVVLVIIIVCLNKKKPATNSNDDMNNIYRLEEVDTSIIEKEYEQVDYINVKNIINSYLDMLNKNNSKYYARNENGEFEYVLTDKEFNQKVYNVLSNVYIKKNNISVNNVSKYIDDITKKEMIVFSRMKALSKDNGNEIYIVEGILKDINYNFIKKQNFIVNLDKTNLIYSIQPLDEEYDNVNVNDYSDVKIVKNDDNQYTGSVVTVQSVPQEYFNNYKDMCLVFQNIAYDKMSNEYKNKRFETLENFQKFIKSNNNEIRKSIFTKYLVNTYSDYTEYVCQDQYENLYIFKVKDNLLDYTVELDTYTLDNETFNEKYNSSNTQYKVMMNVDKVRQMMNARDYRTMFNYLDETFRTTYFENNVDKFEEYMKYHFSSHYNFEFGDYSEDSGISIQEVTIKDMNENNSGDISERFYMQLKDGTEFVMSFNIIGK